jgi:polyisoprenoid-binding protein YceI
VQAPSAAVDKATAPTVAPVVGPVVGPVVAPVGGPASASGSPPAASTAPTKGFLTFDLPSRGLSFSGPQHYRILPSLSRVGFDAKSTLHDFTGVTSKLQGDLFADLAATTPVWRGRVSCDAATLNTGVEGRDEGLRDHLATARHPRIEFELKEFVAAPGGVDVDKRRVKGVVSGQMTIRGKTRPLSMPVEISVDESQRLVIAGQTTLALTDYGVPVPSQLGLISMQDQVKVWISLRARSIGKWDGKD